MEVDTEKVDAAVLALLYLGLHETARAQRAIARDTLPSTSGAHASLPFAKKVARWSVLFGDVVVKTTGARVIARP